MSILSPEGDQSAEERQQAQQEHQEDMTLMQNALQGHDDSPAQIRTDFLEDLKESNLQEGSKDLLRNLISADFLLAYFNESEVTELKFKLEAKKEKFHALHPGPKCEVTGKSRAYINADQSDRLRPLSQEQKLIVDQFFDGIYARITRARGMKQQEILQTSIRESRMQRDDGETEDAGLLNRL